MFKYWHNFYCNINILSNISTTTFIYGQFIYFSTCLKKIVQILLNKIQKKAFVKTKLISITKKYKKANNKIL